MKRFNLYTSNRLEILAEKLAEIISVPLASPMAEEIVIVQSKGMERWISMALARRHGICANVRFPFPNIFVYDNFRKVITGLPEQSPYDRDVMTWKIMRILPACIGKPEFEMIRNYLGEPIDTLRCFQISEKIADTFDQYLLFRPEMIFQWENGDENHWQAGLWRELVKGCEGKHRAALAKSFEKEYSKKAESGRHERISVFGISALPRFHIEVFNVIARFSEVNLFLMNPCEQYWGDILSKREIKRISSKIQLSLFEDSQNELYLEQGNSLLASMGTLGRDFFDLIQEYVSHDDSSFDDPGENTLLQCIQSDILYLRDRGGESGEKSRISDQDTSILIHSCHSPMREIEVLYDRLLKMFEADSELKPGDILVMMPDIEAYSPYIEAVFDVPRNDPRRIPFSIADRSAKTESRIIDIFLQILNQWGGRFTASQVLSILETPSVYKMFHLNEIDLELIRRWIKETRIRWGVDAASRMALGLPGFSENTWKAGMERLLLGYAMPGHGNTLFAGILPYDYIEGNDALVLGHFIEFTEQLFSFVRSLGQPRPLTEWSAALKNLLECFFSSDESTENEIHFIRKIINNLSELQKRADFNEQVDIHVIINHLTHHLQEKGFGFGFMTGSVTFCAMLPMRSIPFKVICLVGMNSNAYPKQSMHVSFDLMAKHPKPGDRSKRNDDRYLFLESILSAREKLFISYIGQSIRDNSILPPSVLVSELEDYIEKGFDLPNKNIIEDHILIKHRLQAFSTAYFTKRMKDDRLFSYSQEYLKAAQCLIKPRKPPLPFISKGLSEPGPEWKTVSLTELGLFFINPAKFLLNRRLGIFLEETDLSLEENEAFEIKGLEKYLLEDNLLKKALEGNDLNDFFSLTKASGQLPHGSVGKCVYDRMISGINNFAVKTKCYIPENPPKPLEIEVDISGFRVKGRMDSIYSGRLIRYRYAKIKPKDHLNIWIYHLILNCLNTISHPSILIGLNKDNNWIAWEYSSVVKAQTILERLLERYWEGLKKPLHFFPESSWKYAEQIFSNKFQDEAIQKARAAWARSGFNRGEVEDMYFQLSFGQSDPLDLEFENLSMEIFEPIMANQNRI